MLREKHCITDLKYRLIIHIYIQESRFEFYHFTNDTSKDCES
jgi:hypothetical protein